MPTTEEFKIKLVSAIDSKNVANSNYAHKVVVFDVPPTIVESGSVDYEAIQITQGPVSFQSYRGTPARTFSMSDIKLISRTPKEARDNIQRINLLRSWRMPYFGQEALGEGEAAQFFKGAVGKQSPLERLTNGGNTLKTRLGAPPEILYFSAYSQSSTEGVAKPHYRGNIRRVPVVLSSLSITYPNDVAYIPTAKRGEIDALGGVPFPTIMTISVELIESHSPGEINTFNLAKYANGVLDGF